MRGQRKYRKRCGYVDPLLGRCRRHVHWSGCTYCSPAHATAARHPATRNTVPGARARHRAAQDATRHQFTTDLLRYADAQERVAITSVVQCVLALQEATYTRGYDAGYKKGADQASMLRLQASREALDTFVLSRLGKSFLMGDLTPQELDRFSFGLRPRE